ncbi:MAG TPA: hypothetical protein VF178_05035 [Gemmatimonadaceae bacterium]
MPISHDEIRRHPAWRDEIAAPIATDVARPVLFDRQLLVWLAMLVIGAALVVGGWLAR